jgi:hypothetical protein
MITSLRPLIGLRDPCLQSARDRYIDKLFRARVLLNIIRRAAAKHRHTRGWWLVQ